jgi:hypothetical protein
MLVTSGNKGCGVLFRQVSKLDGNHWSLKSLKSLVLCNSPLDKLHSTLMQLTTAVGLGHSQNIQGQKAGLCELFPAAAGLGGAATAISLAPLPKRVTPAREPEEVLG